MQLDPAHLAALGAILRHGSFEAAAHALGVTPPAISLRIRALEDRIGAPLLTRSSPISPTAIGARLARHAEEIALIETGLARDLKLENTPGRVRIAVNADSLDTWFLSALTDLDLQIELVVDDQAHSLEWLRRGEVSAAITDHPKPTQGCDVHALGRLQYQATASPEFVARWLDGSPPEQGFSLAPMLQYSAKDRLQRDWLTTHIGQRLSPPTHILPSTCGFVEACCLGLGWGLNPVLLLTAPLNDGRLVTLSPTPVDTALYWHINRVVAGPLARLTQSVRKAAARSLLPAGDSS